MLFKAIEQVSRLIAFDKSRFIFLIIILGFTAMLETFGFASIIPLMESVLDSDNPSNVGRFFQSLFNFFGIELTIYSSALMFLILMLTKNFLRVYSEFLRSDISYAFKTNSIKSIAQSNLNSKYEKYIKAKQGTLINNTITETQNSTMGLQQLVFLISGVITLPLFFFLMLYSSFELTLGLLFVSILVYISLDRPIKNYARKVGLEEIKLNQEITSDITEAYSGFRQIRVLDITDVVIKKIHLKLKRLKFILVKWDVISSSTIPITEMSLVFIIVGYFFLMEAFYTNVDYKNIIPTLSMIVVVAYKSMSQLSRLLVNKMALDRYVPSMSLVGDLINSSSNKLEKREKKKLKSTNYKDLGDLYLDHVNFGYDKNTILKDLTGVFKIGEISLIMGPSGSGKSTLVDILLGLNKPQSGIVSLKGINSLNSNQGDWKSNIGYVSQETFLFHLSIKENLLLGAKRTSIKKIRSFCKLAEIDDFIMSLPNRYDTNLDDKGLNLSGGQRQRISIARALLRDPFILIFDEATSALDKKTSEKIMKNIRSVRKEKIIIFISHDLSMRKYCDSYFEISKGKLVSHEEKN